MSEVTAGKKPIRSYRDLVAWQRSRALVALVYRATGALPRSEQFGLSLQMRRAACSVPANIAEGYGQGRRPAFLHQLRIARGSLFEVQTFVQLAQDLGFLKPAEDLDEMLAEADRVLQGLIRSLESKG